MNCPNCANAGIRAGRSNAVIGTNEQRYCKTGGSSVGDSPGDNDGTAALLASIFDNLAQSNPNGAPRTQKTVLERLLADWQQAYRTIGAQLQSAFAEIRELSQQNATLQNVRAQLLQRAHSAEARALVAEGHSNREHAALEKAEKELAQFKAERAAK